MYGLEGMTWAGLYPGQCCPSAGHWPRRGIGPSPVSVCPEEDGSLGEMRLQQQRWWAILASITARNAGGWRIRMMMMGKTHNIVYPVTYSLPATFSQDSWKRFFKRLDRILSNWWSARPAIVCKKKKMSIPRKLIIAIRRCWIYFWLKTRKRWMK